MRFNPGLPVPFPILWPHRFEVNIQWYPVPDWFRKQPQISYGNHMKYRWENANWCFCRGPFSSKLFHSWNSWWMWYTDILYMIMILSILCMSLLSNCSVKLPSARYDPLSPWSFQQITWHVNLQISWLCPNILGIVLGILLGSVQDQPNISWIENGLTMATSCFPTLPLSNLRDPSASALAPHASWPRIQPWVTTLRPKKTEDSPMPSHHFHPLGSCMKNCSYPPRIHTLLSWDNLQLFVSPTSWRLTVCKIEPNKKVALAMSWKSDFSPALLPFLNAKACLCELFEGVSESVTTQIRRNDSGDIDM